MSSSPLGSQPKQPNSNETKHGDLRTRGKPTTNPYHNQKNTCRRHRCDTRYHVRSSKQPVVHLPTMVSHTSISEKTRRRSMTFKSMPQGVAKWKRRRRPTHTGVLYFHPKDMTRGRGGARAPWQPPSEAACDASTMPAKPGMSSDVATYASNPMHPTVRNCHQRSGTANPLAAHLKRVDDTTPHKS